MIREALESARESVWADDKHTAIAQIDAALRELDAVKPVAWADPVEYDKAASGGQSFNGWRQRYPNTTIPLYAAPPLDAIAEEREACAKVCELMAAKDDTDWYTASECAAAIRARGSCG